MSFLSTELAKLDAFIHTEETAVETEISPILKLAESKGGAAALQLGETLLAGAAVGTPWAQLVATFLAALSKQGITLAEQVASAVLNLAQANLLAKTATATPAA